MEPIILYNMTDVGKILGVGTTAVKNWCTRDSGPMPKPAFQTLKGIPLWTYEQVEEVVAEQVARLKEGRNDR